MTKPERLEITFGKKDLDVWQFLESSGLPKASFAKKIIRDYMNGQIAPVSHFTPVDTANRFTSDSSEQVEYKAPKKTSVFGSIAVKK